jgi:hypothetical protein
MQICASRQVNSFYRANRVPADTKRLDSGGRATAESVADDVDRRDWNRTIECCVQHVTGRVKWCRGRERQDRDIVLVKQTVRSRAGTKARMHKRLTHTNVRGPAWGPELNFPVLSATRAEDGAAIDRLKSASGRCEGRGAAHPPEHRRGIPERSGAKCPTANFGRVLNLR